MKVVLLAAGSSIHTIRWANGLAGAGLDIHLVGQHPLLQPLDDGVKCIEFPYRGNAGYFLMAPAFRRLLKKIRPDVLSAHYASGYGTTARLSGYTPTLLSAWGSDVFDFPDRSLVHRWWVRRNLLAADRVASTSVCMASRIRLVAPSLKQIDVTPFGVPVEWFAGRCTPLRERPNEGPIVIGTVKALTPTYGIDTLILAFASLRRRLLSQSPAVGERLRLRIVGEGSGRKSLETLASEQGILTVTEFVGRVPHDQVPAELNQLDIFVALSRRESFGVAVIEAGAAGRPVVVSDAGGLPEIVKDSITGLIVPLERPDLAAAALARLVMDRSLRIRMGAAALEHVSARYSWEASIAQMISVLDDVRRANHDARRC